ncbi:MASE1 domain-containing protein [Streptomyces sp. KR80]|uniref:MASE1 domain-containing protein n=1 Tax=Streptomyces sp. KR80 TaxID=3457426 RepID=UPI003FD6B9AD
MPAARYDSPRRYAAEAFVILAVAAVYFGAGKLGLLQELVRGQVTPLWPPTGIALTALLLFGLRIWPGIALGAFLVNVTLGWSAAALLAITVGNTLAPVSAYLLLRRTGFRTELDRLRDALALVFLGAMVGMLVSATVGSGTLVLLEDLSASEFWPSWSVWWTGDAMGVLVITPLLLTLRMTPLPREKPSLRWAEAATLGLGTAFVSTLALWSTVQLLFLAFPFLIWAAFRFRLAGAAPCTLIISVLTITAAALGRGPFEVHSLLEQMVILQAFNGCVALTALLLSALVTERENTRQRLENLCASLTEVVTRLAPGDDMRP